MERPDDIELGQDRYRPVFSRPLGSPRALWICAIGFGFFTVLCSWAAWHFGTLWSAFLPVPAAFCLGGVMVGLFPGYFFGKR